MSTNPYESPNTTGDPTPVARSGLGCLVKLFAGVAVVGLVIALFLPATRTAREPARRAQCTNNLKQIALALHNYHDVYHCFPPAHTVDGEGKPLHSWRTLILPFLEQKPLYDTIDLSKPWDDPANKAAYDTTLPVYQCPSNAEPGNSTTYLAVVAPDGCFPPTGCRQLSEITDDRELTLVVLEVDSEHQVHWMSPTDISEEKFLARGTLAMEPHPGGANAAFAAGNVAFLPATTKAETLRAMISIDGNDDAVAEEIR